MAFNIMKISKKNYYAFRDDSEIGEYINSYEANFSNIEIKIVAIWSLNGWRHAWGNDVDEGGGNFLNKDNAINHFNEYRRAGSSWFITMNAGFLIRDCDRLFLMYQMVSNDDYNSYVINSIKNIKIDKIFRRVYENDNLQCFEKESYDDYLLLNHSNIENIGKMRRLN